MSIERERFELWWSKNLGNETYLHNGRAVSSPDLASFASWMGDSKSPDRIAVRKRFDTKGSFLDVGCGAAPEHEGLRADLPEVKYSGVDITPELVAFNKSRGIDCVQGTANYLPFPDNSYDLVHCRHVVEHMRNVNAPLNEFIRVAKKKVFLVFFIGPTFIKSRRNLDNQGTDGEVFHNNYSRREIRKLLKENAKVSSFMFVKLPKPSSYLLEITLTS